MIGSICLSMFTCKTHVQMKPASCFRLSTLAPRFCLSRLRAGRQRRQRCLHVKIYDIYIYNILFLARKNLRCANAMRACKIAQSQILRAVQFSFFARALSKCARLMLYIFNFVCLRAHSEKNCTTDISVAQYKLSSLENTLVSPHN